jgi:hypothetical protein
MKRLRVERMVERGGETGGERKRQGYRGEGKW